MCISRLTAHSLNIEAHKLNIEAHKLKPKPVFKGKLPAPPPGSVGLKIWTFPILLFNPRTHTLLCSFCSWKKDGNSTRNRVELDFWVVNMMMMAGNVCECMRLYIVAESEKESLCDKGKKWRIYQLICKPVRDMLCCCWTLSSWTTNLQVVY